MAAGRVRDYRERAGYDFSAEDGGASFGRELDVSATRLLGRGHALTFKTAFFNAKTAAFTDTGKDWLMFTATY